MEMFLSLKKKTIFGNTFCGDAMNISLYIGQRMGVALIGTSSMMVNPDRFQGLELKGGRMGGSAVS